MRTSGQQAGRASREQTYRAIGSISFPRASAAAGHPAILIPVCPRAESGTLTRSAPSRPRNRRPSVTTIVLPRSHPESRMMRTDWNTTMPGLRSGEKGVFRVVELIEQSKQ